MNAVRYWETRNDANHNNRHAEANGIEFGAFPYQSYLAYIDGQYGATLSKQYTRHGYLWMANIYFRDTKREPTIAHQEFENQDDAFLWASQQLIERNK
jgi:hypothetical protein